jgi:Phytanoyl-CoA dioxygenase (PhyH)
LPLDIPHLKRFWSQRAGILENETASDWVADNTLLSGLRVGLKETFHYLHSNKPAFEEFETWILEKNGGAIAPDRIQRLNAALSGNPVPHVNPLGPVLTAEDLEFWNENGYVILHDAVPPGQCDAAAQAIYDFLRMDPAQAGTWYGGSQGHSIWIPLLHHPALWANRDSPRIHRAFSQLWGRDDLWVSVDQGGMNPPEKPGWRFPGPNLHFDVSLALPIPFGVQGILYLTDTEANQGAFTCVPGFHRIVEDWLNNLPPGADPRQQDLAKLGAVPIAGRAGDLIVWHHALPHGSSPNRAAKPRVVQYIKMMPSQWEYNPIWR